MSFVLLRHAQGTPLDSETGWTEELWSNPILERGNTILLLLLLLCRAFFLYFLIFYIFIFYFFILFGFFLYYFVFFGFFFNFGIFEFFENFWIFFWISSVFLGFLSKLLRLLLKVTKVTTGHQKFPKMGQNSIISSLFFCPKGEKSLGRRPKPSTGARSRPRSGPYLLVLINGLSILHDFKFAISAARPL